MQEVSLLTVTVPGIGNIHVGLCHLQCVEGCHRQREAGTYRWEVVPGQTYNSIRGSPSPLTDQHTITKPPRRGTRKCSPETLVPSRKSATKFSVSESVQQQQAEDARSRCESGAILTGLFLSTLCIAHFLLQGSPNYMRCFFCNFVLSWTFIPWVVGK